MQDEIQKTGKLVGITLYMSFFALVVIPSTVFSGTYDIPTHILDGGGNEGNSRSYRIVDSIGQSITGTNQSANYREYIGYWHTLGEIRLLGDVTNNGAVTAYDAARILQHTVGLWTLTDVDSVAADVSGNNTVSAYDAALVLQYVVGNIRIFPAEEDRVVKVVYSIRTVWMGEVKALADGGKWLSILIDEMDGVVAGELTLSFEGKRRDVEVSISELTGSYLLASKVEEGRIRASFAGVESKSGSGSVLEIVLGESDAGLLSSLRLERVFLNEGRIPVRIVRDAETPKAYRLAQNVPNPFNPQTTITYDVAKSGTVRLSVYALTGQHIRTLVDGERAAGRYSVVWDGTDDGGQDVASGVYLCRMKAGGYRAVRKLVLVR